MPRKCFENQEGVTIHVSMDEVCTGEHSQKDDSEDGCDYDESVVTFLPSETTDLRKKMDDWGRGKKRN